MFDELYVGYNEFKSAIQQRVIVEKLFPIDAATDSGPAKARYTSLPSAVVISTSRTRASY